MRNGVSSLGFANRDKDILVLHPICDMTLLSQCLCVGVCLLLSMKIKCRSSRHKELKEGQLIARRRMTCRRERKQLVELRVSVV